MSDVSLQKIRIQSFKGISDITIENCGKINAFIGKNNSGKSTILHAIDIGCLAIKVGDWNSFQPKLAIKDLISDVGKFEITFTYSNLAEVTVKSEAGYGPQVRPSLPDEQNPKSILILPDVGHSMQRREHKTPKTIIQRIESKDFTNVNSLEILYAIKFYSDRRERGLTPEKYMEIVDSISNFFPDISGIISSRTEDDHSTLTYEEYGKRIDILYSGTGLKHFLDILVKTTLSKPDIVLLDEPELGLHPDLQRRFFEYLHDLAIKEKIQIFLGTHSQVILNYAETINFYRIINKSGRREILPVAKEAIHTVLSDLGIRPSDLFNQDICLLVEGQTDVIYWENIIRRIYKSEFEKIAIGIIQYGGASADGIIGDKINVSNIVPVQKYVYWLRDRDSKPTEIPSTNSTRFLNKLVSLGFECHIMEKREIEYYFSNEVLVSAQDGDDSKASSALTILNGDQGNKFRKAAELNGVCVPQGKFLKGLLESHLTNKDMIPPEINSIVARLLLWKNEILGDE